MVNKIIWSNEAVAQFEQTIEYWTKRNKSGSYSDKIVFRTNEVIKLIVLNPNIGISTKYKSIKMRIVLDRFYVFYRENDEVLEILKFWDTRQNPVRNKYWK